MQIGVLLIFFFLFTYGLAAQLDNETSILDDMSSPERFEQPSDLLQVDDAGALGAPNESLRDNFLKQWRNKGEFCADFDGFWKRFSLRSVAKKRCGSQYPYCYKNKCYLGSTSWTNNGKFCSASNTGNHCSKCSVNHALHFQVLSVGGSMKHATMTTFAGFKSVNRLKPCCKLKSACLFISKLQVLKKDLEDIQGRYHNPGLAMRTAKSNSRAKRYYHLCRQKIHLHHSRQQEEGRCAAGRF